jgi:glycosyltransferase involved in cell wall biosynthesis
VDTFHYVPWPLAMDPPSSLPPAPGEPLVVSAGRAYCDWETLFAAARGAGWPLTVVCRKQDMRRVEALNDSGQATVRCEIPREEFLSLLDRATLSVVAMLESHTSQGHIRVMDAIARGIPVVATATTSLEGYVSDGETAQLVPPGDPGALRAAVDQLLADAEARERLRTAAYEHALRWQVPDYFEALGAIAHGRPVTLPASAPGAS